MAPAPSSADPESLALSILDKMSALSTPMAGEAVTSVFTPPAASPVAAAPPSSAPPPAAAGGGIQRAEEFTAPTTNPPAGSSLIPGGQEAEPMARPSDEDLTNLSRWLYPLIRYRLKGELREDRERAGLVTDHYRRW